MPKQTLDTKGMLCPQPILKIAAIVPKMKPGDVLEVIGDCPTFEEDVRKWCTRLNKTLMAVQRSGHVVTVLIQL
jgi:tRNA 2-thiouridine synthesizing protein A